MLLDELQGGSHFGDALAGEVLEIARLEDAGDLVENVARKILILDVVDRGGERLGGFLDLLARLQDAMGGGFRRRLRHSAPG